LICSRHSPIHWLYTPSLHDALPILSGMMDGQVAAVRTALDDAGFSNAAILAYAAKYASAFYGPFREAVQSSLQGDRRSYQLDPRSEEHTSELQSRENLVCRLLLEQK